MANGEDLLSEYPGYVQAPEMTLRQKWALAQLQQAQSAAPVAHPLQAVARALQGFAGGQAFRQAEQEGRQQEAKAIADWQREIAALGGGAPMGPVAPAAATPRETPAPEGSPAARVQEGFRALTTEPTAAAPAPPPRTAMASAVPGGGITTRGSWYSQAPGWVDRGDRPGSNALGVPDTQQGIALPSRNTLGQWFDVTMPSGQSYRLQQTDVGPARWTGRGVDVSAAAASGMGYTPKTFPTDAPISVKPASAPEGGGTQVAQAGPAPGAGGGSSIPPGLLAATARLPPNMRQIGMAIIQERLKGQHPTLTKIINPATQREESVWAYPSGRIVPAQIEGAAPPGPKGAIQKKIDDLVAQGADPKIATQEITRQAIGKELPMEKAFPLAMMDTGAKELAGKAPGKEHALKDVLTGDWDAGKIKDYYAARFGFTGAAGDVGLAYRAIGRQVEGALRAMTGAAAPPHELAQYGDMFMPNPWDSPASRAQKLAAIETLRIEARKILESGRVLRLDEANAVINGLTPNVSAAPPPATPPPATTPAAGGWGKAERVQ